MADFVRESVAECMARRHLSFGGGAVLAGTSLMLQGTAQILYAKIARRMYQSGEITVRDAYDLATAAIHDPEALSQACGHASPRVLSTVSAIVESLPNGWSADDMKAQIAPKHQWSERELQERLLAALEVETARRGKLDAVEHYSA